MARRFLLILLVACSSSPPKQAVPAGAKLPAQGVVADAGVAVAKPDARPPDAPPDAPRCPPQNPKGCPAAEPNVNRPCDVKAVECVYDDNCCHEITYVCAKNKHFEAHIQRCN